MKKRVKKSQQKIELEKKGTINKKPDSIFAAVNILYIVLVIGAIRSFIADEGGDYLLINIIGIVITFFLIYLINQGKKWARTAYLVIFIISAPISLLGVLGSFYMSPILGIWIAIELGLEILALKFLYSHLSSAWFDSIK
jgi:hypothetical protein